MAVVHVSGHVKISAAEFTEHYLPKLLEHCQQSDEFVVGDARGVDTLAQHWLKEHGAKVTVYHMFDSPRNNAGFPTQGGFTSDEERDAAMTAVSDTDIAWVRPGKENSGTAKNLLRRSASRQSHLSTPIEKG